jgi:hypothetical protein
MKPVSTMRLTSPEAERFVAALGIVSDSMLRRADWVVVTGGAGARVVLMSCSFLKQ